MKRILLLLCGIMLVPVIACSQHLVEVGKGIAVLRSIRRSFGIIRWLHTVMNNISVITITMAIWYLESGNWIRNNGHYIAPNIRKCEGCS